MSKTFEDLARDLADSAGACYPAVCQYRHVFGLVDLLSTDPQYTGIGSHDLADKRIQRTLELDLGMTRYETPNPWFTRASLSQFADYLELKIDLEQRAQELQGAAAR